jgi:hypothetical protein
LPVYDLQSDLKPVVICTKLTNPVRLIFVEQYMDNTGTVRDNICNHEKNNSAKTFFTPEIWDKFIDLVEKTQSQEVDKKKYLLKIKEILQSRYFPEREVVLQMTKID